MQWFILSRDMHVIAMPSTDAPKSLPIFNDKQMVSITNNTVVSTYDFSVQQKHPDAGTLQMGNYIAFRDKYNKMKLYTLVSYDGDDLIQTWHAEDIGLDLLNETADKWDYTGEPHDIAWYLDNLILKDTGWSIGFNEIGNLTRALKFEGQSDTLLKRLGDVANQFDGAEIDFTIEMESNHVTRQVINIHKKIGSPLIQDRYIDSVNLKSLKTSGSIANLCTSMIGYGSQPDPAEGQDASDLPPIDFSNISYDDGQFYSPVGDKHLYDRVSHLQWSRFKAFNYANQGEFDGYINGIYTYDTKDPQELLNRTLMELKKRNHAEQIYEADLLSIEADVGDYVQIAHNNYNPPIYLQARIESVTNCYTAKGQDTGVLGDYTLLESEIDPRVKDMLDALKNQIKGNFTWTRYAEDANGTGMTAAPNIRTTHVAFLSNQKTGVPSDDPADYAGHWVRIKGDKGDKGADGEDGVAGKDGVGVKTTTITYAQSTNGTTPPTASWTASVPTLIKGQYLWTRTVWTYTDSSTETGYTVSYNAKDGNDGSDGVAGKDGVGISSTVIEYVGAVSGTSNPTSGWGTTIPAVPAGQYLWTRTTWQYTDGTSEQGFTNALMGRSGDKGDPGNQGIPGKPGADGRTPYTHWAYGWSADGKDGFTTVYPNLNLLTGTSNVQDYTISGSQWVTGSQSKNGGNISFPSTPGASYTYSTIVKSATFDCYVELQFFDSDKKLISTNYSTAKTDIGLRYVSGVAPAGTAFLLIQTVLNHPPDSQTVVFNSEKLELGSTTTPWTPSPLDDPEGAYPKFIGTYTDYITEDSTDPSKYTWAKLRGEQGPKGDTGEDGVAGKDGIGVKSTTVTYQASTSGTTAPTGAWVASPTAVAGQYQWTRTVWTYTDGTTEVGYSVGHIGVDGATGKDGVAGKDGVGIKTTAITYATSTSGTSAPTSGWVSAPPSAAAGQFIWTRTIWTYTDNTTETGYSVGKIGEKGDKGDTGVGIPGTPGTDGRTPYLHTAWANSFDGKNGFSTDVSTNKSYMGTYVNFTEADPTDPALYNWSLIKGADGSDGAPGKPGVDGKTPYFHQAWADSKDGKIDFSTTDPTNRGYLGTYSDFTQADSTDPSKYFWVELVGAIEIGGRNLVSGTNQEYAMGYGIPTTSWKDGYAYLKLPTNVINGEILPSEPHTFWHTMTQGATYTQSIWFETDATVKDLSAVQITWYTSAGHDYQPARVQKLGQNSYKIVSTYTWPGKSDNNVRLFDIGALNSSFDLSTGTYLKFGKLKLEIGNKATDWSPAPEDTQGQIDKVNNGLADTNSKIAAVTKVDSQATAPTNPKKGDQWWVKDANGNINAFKIWDGTKWADSIIQQSAMNINTLNGNTINGATINGSKFTSNFSQEYTGNVKDGPLLEGVQTIGNGSYTVDYKVKGTKARRGYTQIQPDGLVSYITDEDGNVQALGSLLQGSFYSMNKNASGFLTPEDVERTDREVWTTHAGGDGDQIMGLTKQFRRVWFDGTLFIPQGQWNGNIGNYNKVLQIKNHKLYPKSNKIIGVTTLGNNSETASIQVQPDGWIVVVWSSRAQRILVEGCFYTLDF